MRRLVLVEFLTVDGVVQGLGSPDEDRRGGFEHGGWGVPYAADVHATLGADGVSGTGAYLFGRRTYEKMAEFWPDQPDANPIAAHMNATPKHVASRTLRDEDLRWAGATVLQGDLAPAVGELLADGDGDVAVLGSGDLARQLLRLDVVDELRLIVHPLLLGTGTRLFGELPAPRALRLVRHDVTAAGSLVLGYELARDGAPVA
ncbi:dihydrofolate reductase family protein [Dermatobacter hominis]|uniref:dihydrofolate reductase family protein n=1 Tax=Dermatobacter hominis TaxID=2884263 RepID=UPI001D112876|nr:dihydrofolate reductase family protein [Dermatobacter hominis]UDY34401.1 dihydrofolate reductase family protein [Dermatobacter hominis]